MKLAVLLMCLSAVSVRAQSSEPSTGQVAATATARVGLELILGAGAQYALFTSAVVVGCHLGACLFGAVLGLAAGAPLGIAAADLLFEPSPHLGGAYAGELLGALVAVVIFTTHPWSNFTQDDLWLVVLGTATPTLFAVIGSELMVPGTPLVSITPSGGPQIGWSVRF
jgi:hypothetical protein